MVPAATIPYRSHGPRVVVLALVLLAALTLSGCTEVQLIARYDEETVQAVTTLLRKIDGTLIKLQRALETPGGAEDAAYDKHTGFYDEVYVDLNVIRARAAAIPKNERTEEQLALFEGIVRDFEAQHRRGLSLEYVRTSRRLINEAIRSILKAEAAKPRRSP